MRLRSVFVGSLMLLGVVPGTAPAAANADLGKTQESELPAVNASIDTEIGEVPYRYRMYLSSAGSGDGPARSRLRMVLDLGGAVSALADTLHQRAPSERCARRKADNWVVRPRELSAEVHDEALLLGLGAEVELWACVDLKFLGKAKSELADGRIWLELPLILDAQAQRVSLHYGEPRVRVHGGLGRAARLYFAARGEDLGERLAQRVNHLDQDQLQFDLPAILIANGAHIERARFVSEGGMPQAEIEIIANAGMLNWMALLRRLWGWSE